MSALSGYFYGILEHRQAPYNSVKSKIFISPVITGFLNVGTIDIWTG